MALTMRKVATPATARAARAPLAIPRSRPATCTRAIPLHLLAEVGDVDAPIGVIIGAAAVITIAFTALVPLALSPGQDAANKIFDSKAKAPLDKNDVKGVTKKASKGR